MANLDEEDILPETVYVGEKKSDELYATITRLAEEKRQLFVENADLRAAMFGPPAEENNKTDKNGDTWWGRYVSPHFDQFKRQMQKIDEENRMLKHIDLPNLQDENAALKVEIAELKATLDDIRERGRDI